MMMAIMIICKLVFEPYIIISWKNYIYFFHFSGSNVLIYYNFNYSIIAK